MKPNCCYGCHGKQELTNQEMCLIIKIWEKSEKEKICFHSALDLCMHKLPAKGFLGHCIFFIISRKKEKKSQKGTIK